MREGGRKGAIDCWGDLRNIYASGTQKEAELVLRKDKWHLFLVTESPDPPSSNQGSQWKWTMGENKLAASSTGKVIGGTRLRGKA
jgi:hypothetical protein